MTSISMKVVCVVVKKTGHDCKWSEIAFEDAETGKRFKPKVMIPHASKNEEQSSSCGPIHSRLHHLGHDASVLSIDDELSLSNVLRKSIASKNDEFKPKRRGSLGRLAQRLGKRSGDDPADDLTISTNQSSSYCSIGDEDNNENESSSLSFPPCDVRTVPLNRFQFMNKQRTNNTNKYVGFKEMARKQQQSEERRGVINSALYTCMESEDNEEDLLSNILRATEDLVRNTPANHAA